MMLNVIAAQDAAYRARSAVPGAGSMHRHSAHHPRSGAAVPSSAAVRSGAPTAPLRASALRPGFPWPYDGAAGTYKTSGAPAGLPNIRLSGTRRARHRSWSCLRATRSTAGGTGMLPVTNTIVYFEPGLHAILNGNIRKPPRPTSADMTRLSGKAIHRRARRRRAGR